MDIDDYLDNEREYFDPNEWTEEEIDEFLALLDEKEG